MRIGIILVSLLLASCSWLMPHKVEIRQGNLISPEMRARIKVGMTQQQVKAVLGTPMVSDPFHPNRWDYVYRFTQEGELVESHHLILYFDKDSVSRIVDDSPASSEQVNHEQN